jgi:hypothetical protein
MQRYKNLKGFKIKDYKCFTVCFRYNKRRVLHIRKPKKSLGS